jgi:hypothetical protein
VTKFTGSRNLSEILTQRFAINNHMLIKIRITTVWIILMIASLNCKSQDGETYWRLSTIYREDKSVFKGLTADAMQEILDYNFHFIRRADRLYFEVPAKFSVDLSGFKSLAQLQIRDREYCKMYSQSFDGDIFKVKFKDLSTTTESKNTVMEFTRISKAAYEDDINKEIARQKAIANEINALKQQLISSPQILLDPLEKLPQKSQVIEDDKEDKINLLIPEEIDLKKTGQIKTEQFGAIKIGTFTKNSVVYDVRHSKKDYGLKQLAIWVSTDQADFDLESWKKTRPNRLIFKDDRNGVIGYELDYDAGKQKAIIRSVFCLKYKKVAQAHIFVYADVFRSQFGGNYDPLTEMNVILNFNTLILDNITIQ